MPAQEMRLPVELSDEPLVGWRCWYVLPHEGLLRPIYKRGLVWKPRQAHEAVCPEDPHEVPADGCKCGLWAVCHPMLLEEVAWAFAPPDGISPLPGVVVVGQVALWGKIIEHGRGWRAGVAYPRHLYALTDDPMVAETLRERYGIPVEWGEEANRLRRLLPPSAEKPDEVDETPTLREVLLDVLHQGLASGALVAAVEAMLDADRTSLTPPAERHKEWRRHLDACCRAERRVARLNVELAAAEKAAMAGNSLAARRALWVRWVQARMVTAQKLWDKGIKPAIDARASLVEDLARGTSNGPNGRGRPYARISLDNKRRALERIEKREIPLLVGKIEALMAAVEIPTYREWCGITRGAISSPPKAAQASDEDRRQWHRQAVQRQEQLAEQERALALQRHQLIREREAIEAERAAVDSQLEAERAQLASQGASLRQDVIASIERDRAELLQEVGELERRRRAALAMLPGAWPPAERPSVLAPAKLRSGPHPLKAQLEGAGITQQEVALAAGVSRSSVCNFLAGRSTSRRTAEAAERLLRQYREALTEASTR